ncbi:hypothetical protein [Buchnera aphidicola]|uniref:hypothetical protein n=1 Tax=Buchnera aphidicola TaxID=9 RepID=UPI000AF89E23|nr:hypothetical protein [Buchnera aphidicola]
MQYLHFSGNYHFSLNRRLDCFLVILFPKCSRTYLSSLIKKKKVFINGINILSLKKKS